MCAENIHIHTGNPISNHSPDNPLQTHDTARCVPHMLIFLEQEHLSSFAAYRCPTRGVLELLRLIGRLADSFAGERPK